ncbi:MAG: hypothetical protein WHS82_03860 [Candidatus Methanosuratincola sp.]
MALFEILFQSYTFSGIISLIINSIGIPTCIVLLFAYFAAITYLVTLPGRSSLSSDAAKGRVIGFIQQAFYIFSFTMILIPFVSGLLDFFVVLFFYSLFSIPQFLTAWQLGRVTSYEQYIEYKTKWTRGIASFTTDYRRSAGIASIWVALAIGMLYFLAADPSMSFLGWIIIIYTIAMSLLSAALGQSIIHHIIRIPFVKIITIKGKEIVGFIESKDTDHLCIISKQEILYLPMSQIEVILPVKMPIPEKQTIDNLQS